MLLLLLHVFTFVSCQEPTSLSNALRFKFEPFDQKCESASGRNPCQDVRVCKFAKASIMMNGWPVECGKVGKGVPKVCCGLPLALGEGLMKTVEEEKARARECGRRSMSLNLSPTENEFFRVLSSIPDTDISNPEIFDPPLDLNQESMASSISISRITRQSDFPWMVVIFIDNTFICGGVLIDRVHVLSSASCFVSNGPVPDASKYIIRVGNVHLDWGVPFSVSKIVIHEGYVPSSIHHDLAIATLSQEILTPVIPNICLPAEDVLDTNLTGVVVTEIVWTAGPKQLYLNITDDMPVFSNMDCCTIYKQSGDKYLRNGITSNVICAGYQGIPSKECKVDAGGILTIKNNKMNLPYYSPDIPWDLVGLVSNAFTCVGQNYPRVYTRIFNYLDWIRAHT